MKNYLCMHGYVIVAMVWDIKKPEKTRWGQLGEDPYKQQWEPLRL